jgi:hypothetical protein
VIDPIRPEFRRMEKVLFKQFKLSKWLELGFCALLAGLPSLGGLGGSGAINPSFRGTFNHGETPCSGFASSWEKPWLPPF